MLDDTLKSLAVLIKADMEADGGDVKDWYVVDFYVKQLRLYYNMAICNKKAIPDGEFKRLITQLSNESRLIWGIDLEIYIDAKITRLIYELAHSH